MFEQGGLAVSALCPLAPRSALLAWCLVNVLAEWVGERWRLTLEGSVAPSHILLPNSCLLVLLVFTLIL